MRIKLIATSVLLAAWGVPAQAEVVATPVESAKTSIAASPSLRGIEEEVWHTVQDWAAAWSARDAFSFLAFYSKEFRPEDGSTFDDWSRRRRVYFRQTKLVEVTVAFPALRIIDDKHAKVRFTQSLKAGQTQALDEKTMSLAKIGGLWMITEEESLSSRVDPISSTRVAEQQPASAASQSGVAAGQTLAGSPIAASPLTTPTVDQHASEEIALTLQEWAKAWSSKQETYFFAFYGAGFRPNDGTSLDLWKKRRREYFQKVKVINVDLSEQSIEFKGKHRAEVRLTQAFQSDRLKETSRKMLVLEMVGGSWKIVAEKPDPRLAEYQLAKIEAARIDAAKIQAAKVEASKAEAAKVEAAKVEAAKVEAAKVEAAKVEAAKIQAAKVEASKAEAAKAEAAKVEAAKVEAGRLQASVPVNPETQIVDPTALGLEAWGAVQGWAHAWSALDADAFIGHYGTAFMPEDGSTRAAWEERRRDYFKRVKYIEVGLDRPVLKLRDATHVEIQFDQSFRSNIYREGPKQKWLTLEKSDGQWKIVAEQADSVVRSKLEAAKSAAAKAEAATLEQARVEGARAEASRVKAEADKAKSVAAGEAAKTKAEIARIEVARTEALKAEAAKAKADAARAKVEADAEVMRAKVEVARAEQAKTEAARAEAAKAKAEAARAKAEAEADAARSRVAAAKADTPVVAPVIKPDPVHAAQIKQVEDWVAAWAKVWAARDINAYLASYGEHFQPAGGETLVAWEAQRRARIGKAKTIEVGIEGLSVESLDGAYVKARFTQRYRSDNYRDVVSKTLILENTASGWRIVREEAGAMAKPTSTR